ncbi:MAG: hypothetical protein A4E19_17885 [Nitrospira sp. SG-bin1]|nr:MAG: hypothetical protein A4E19_17885 [Nitrospira sp. SG-bin1]
MKCPECLTENDASATKCSMCGHSFAPPPVRPVVYTSFYGGYFAFRELVTPHLIKTIYIVGACFITAAGIWAILSPETLVGYGEYPILSRFGGIMVLLVGNLVWRMACEAAILLFSLHEILVSLDNRARALMLRDQAHHP